MTTVDVKDIEAHGFKLEPRENPEDPFIFYKAILIDPVPDRNWDEHGYFVRLVFLYPEGTCIIHVLDPSDRYRVVKKSKAYRDDREAKLPCHFHGTVKTKEELDSVIEMTFKRDEMFDFSPELEEPSQNYWVDMVVQLDKHMG